MTAPTSAQKRHRDDLVNHMIGAHSWRFSFTRMQSTRDIAKKHRVLHRGCTWKAET